MDPKVKELTRLLEIVRLCSAEYISTVACVEHTTLIEYGSNRNKHFFDEFLVKQGRLDLAVNQLKQFIQANPDLETFQGFHE